MAVYHRDDHDHVVTPASTTTIIEERSSSGGLIVGLIVGLVIVGLIAWALFSSGMFGGSAVPAGTGPDRSTSVDVNSNQSFNPTGNQPGDAPAQPAAPSSNQAPAGGEGRGGR